MCVIAACKIPTSNGGTEIVIAKNRDRNYVPDINFHSHTIDKVTYNVFVDQDTLWCEGINNKGICIVNASLSVIDDENAIKKSKKNKSLSLSQEGDVFKKALKMKDIKKVVDYIVKNDVMGFTFVTDGTNLYVIECACERREIDKVDNKIVTKKELPSDDKPKKEIVKYSCQWFKVSDEDFGEDGFIIRTNHGEFFDDTGYPVESDDGQSTRSRKEEAEKAFRRLKPTTIEGIFKCLSVEPHKNSSLNPLRRKGKSKMFTTGQYVMVPSEQTIYYKPIHCNVTVNNEKVDTTDSIYKIGKKIVESFKSFYFDFVLI